MKITALCCTYNRPRLLAYMLWCFTQQTHQDRELIILDDAGQYRQTHGDRWRIVSVGERYPTLGAKRNALAQLAGETDALAIWDDDDLYTPWALEATCAALEAAPWSRPSLILARTQHGLRPLRTYREADKSDRAYHGSWGYLREAFWAVGGYPPEVSVGEDAALAVRFMRQRIPDADPIELNHSPFYLFAPWGNVHLGMHSYEAWPLAPPSGEPITLEPRQPVVRLDTTAIQGELLRRPFGGNWLNYQRRN